jgi:hypothetical protein
MRVLLKRQVSRARPSNEEKSFQFSVGHQHLQVDYTPNGHSDTFILPANSSSPTNCVLAVTKR